VKGIEYGVPCRAYPAVPLFIFVLPVAFTLLCPYFFALPCCAVIFCAPTMPCSCCALIFCRPYPAVLLLFFALIINSRSFQGIRVRQRALPVPLYTSKSTRLQRTPPELHSSTPTRLQPPELRFLHTYPPQHASRASYLYDSTSARLQRASRALEANVCAHAARLQSSRALEANAYTPAARLPSSIPLCLYVYTPPELPSSIPPRLHA